MPIFSSVCSRSYVLENHKTCLAQIVVGFALPEYLSSYGMRVFSQDLVLSWGVGLVEISPRTVERKKLHEAWLKIDMKDSTCTPSIGHSAWWKSNIIGSVVLSWN